MPVTVACVALYWDFDTMGKYIYWKEETIPEPVFQNGKLFPGNFSKMENSSQTNLLNCTQLWDKFYQKLN